MEWNGMIWKIRKVEWNEKIEWNEMRKTSTPNKGLYNAIISKIRSHS